MIFAVAVVVWALAYFPRSPDVEAAQARGRGRSRGDVDGRRARGAARARSTIRRPRTTSRRAGSAERGSGSSPCSAPLGWDWRVSAAVIAGFPAREVVVAVLGTIYAVGDEADEETLAGQAHVRRSMPDGSPVFTLPMVLGLLAVLRVVLAMRGDARRHSPRNEQLALAGVRVELHDRARLRRRVADLPTGDAVMRLAAVALQRLARAGARGAWRTAASSRSSARWRCRRSTGSRTRFTAFSRVDWAQILPITTDGEAVLVRQYRHGAQRVTLEIPGGLGRSRRGSCDRRAARVSRGDGLSRARRTAARCRESESRRCSRIGCMPSTRATSSSSAPCRTPGPSSRRWCSSPCAELEELLLAGEIDHALVAGTLWRYLRLHRPR